jgi:redox-sensitive bicupin YhaK (pirin superfamily)
MSGPVASQDVPPGAPQAVAEKATLEVLAGREAEVGGFGVVRVLPRRLRRTVGPWCFVDHMGPGAVTEQAGLNIGPHPHIGLQTLTWLVEGHVLHRDSLGSEQLIRPGQVNLMTAGHGVSHSEETGGVYRGRLHGVQLWIAQPSQTRDGPPAFEHHADLPRSEQPGCTATVIVGRLAGSSSPARRDTDHLGVELHLTGGRAVLPLQDRFEHALVVMQGAVRVRGQIIEPGLLAYLGSNRQELAVETTEPARVLLLGGTPFPEPLLMWWNYVARSQDEIITAHRDWSAATPRFGTVPSPLSRITTPGPNWR